MTLLSGANSKKISHLAHTFNNHRAVIEAVVNGNVKGWIMVDDDTKPSCFFLHDDGGFFYLHGAPTNAFIEQISNHLFKKKYQVLY